MNKHQKVAVIIWTLDPEENKRYLLRHNKPFNGYEDEWTITFGDIEPNENLEDAARREAYEEFGINEVEETKNLNYKIEFEGKHGLTEAHFVALKVKDINIPIQLNEESIGYDWMLIDKVKEIMKHEDEKKALNLIK
jgi:8-oxo-dGTP pyrophosphatase MutT (NUDIX family)